MSRVDLRTLEGRIHFMGIGGAGMCALAELMLRDGGQVSGCDLKMGESARHLQALGAEVMIGHDASHVAGLAALVRTAAVPEDHPELVAARALGIPVLKRAEALGAVVNTGRVIAIAGTHGKTSTTAMTVRVLEEGGQDPTGFVGGSVAAWGGNLRRGSDLYVVEADEYDRSFHTLEPDVAVVTNLEADHLDIYGDLAGVREAFEIFLGALRPGGRAVICADDTGASALLTSVGGAGYTYGTSAGSQLRAVEVSAHGTGTRFRVIEEGKDQGEARIPLPGLHNLRNGLAAAAVARHLGVSWAAIHAGWASFEGVGRRFEVLGERAGVMVVDDYAHHPTEVAATLSAARDAFPGRRLVVAFQPHLYSRTRDFADEFGTTLSAADEVWLTDIFPAREAPIDGVDSELIGRVVESAGTPLRRHGDVATLADAMATAVGAGDLVLTMGAGSIEQTGPALVARLEAPIHA